jgi:hypothetical protein
MAQHYNPHIVTDGLKLLIDPKDETCNGGKSVMTDLSGNLNSGSLYSGVGLKFDGVDDWAPIADSSLWDFGTGNFSISCWVRLDTNPLTSDGLVGATEGGDGSNNGWTLHLQLDSSDISGRFYYLSGGSGLHLTTSPTFTADSKFHHVVAVRDGDSITVYADGVAGTATTGVASTSINSTSNNEGITLGSYYAPSNASGNADNNLLNGYLSDVRIYHGALSAAQVSQIYNKPNTVLPGNVSGSQLKGWWPLIEGSGTTALDNSSNSNNSTFNSAPIWISGSATIPQTATGFEYSSSLVSNPNEGWFEFVSGSHNYVAIGDSSDLTFSTGDFTLETWVMFHQIPGFAQGFMFFEKFYESSNKSFRFAYYGGDGANDLGLWYNHSTNGSNETISQHYDWTATANRWYHIALSRGSVSSGGYILCIDGAVVQTFSNSDDIYDSSNALLIGGKTYHSTVGKFASTKIYKGKGLSSVEVLQNFNAQRGRFGV